METRRHTFFAKKQSRKTHPGLDRSLMVIRSDAGETMLEFSIEHRDDKQYPYGGYAAYVKKGFIAENPAPVFAIKKFSTYHSGETYLKKRQRYAMRSAYFSRMLGRNAYAYCYKNKLYMITDFFAGKSLSEIRPKLIKRIPIEERLKYARDLLGQARTLHQLGLIHRDIKPSNVIITRESAMLIDLDGITFEGDPVEPSTCWTMQFLDEDLYIKVNESRNDASKHFDKQSDVYALGLTLCALFPDVMEPCYAFESSYKQLSDDDMVIIEKVPFEFYTVKVTEGRDYNKHQVLADFLKMLISNDKEFRPKSAESAFDLLNEICRATYKMDPPALQNMPDLPDLDVILRELKNIEAEMADFSLEQFRSNAVDKKRQAEMRLHQKADSARISNLIVQLIEIASTVLVIDRVHQVDNRKYDAMADVLADMTHSSFSPGLCTVSQLKRLARVFFHLALQRNIVGVSNTTESGLVIRKMINEDNAIELKEALFDNFNGEISYHQLREFVCGSNDVKLFSRVNRDRVLENYQQFDNNLDDPITVEKLDLGITYRGL